MSAGFACPHCGGQTEVKDSRPRTGGGIRRRRRCDACQMRFTTYEVGADETNFVLAPLEGREPGVIAQATEAVNIIARLDKDDRLLLMGMARRLHHGAGVSDPLREAINRMAAE